jgi:hypothetical protein
MKSTQLSGWYGIIIGILIGIVILVVYLPHSAKSASPPQQKVCQNNDRVEHLALSALSGSAYVEVAYTCKNSPNIISHYAFLP